MFLFPFENFVNICAVFLLKHAATAETDQCTMIEDGLTYSM